MTKTNTQWRLQSEARQFGHTLRIYQRDYMLIMQIDDLCFVGWANEHGNMVLPHKLPVVNNLDAAKTLCEAVEKMGGDA